jgi:hypothetical protein
MYVNFGHLGFVSTHTNLDTSDETILIEKYNGCRIIVLHVLLAAEETGV